VGAANFFLDQSIGIDETNKSQLTFCIKHEYCGPHRFFLDQSIGTEDTNTFQLFVGVKVGDNNNAF